LALGILGFALAAISLYPLMLIFSTWFILPGVSFLFRLGFSGACIVLIWLFGLGSKRCFVVLQRNRMKLMPDETEISGHRVIRSRTVTEDPNESRIEWLIANSFIRIRESDSGWSTLYRDRWDGRLWELRYPASESHGGGPKQIRLVEEFEAQEKYGATAEPQK
jgi:hypothetical protein